MTRSGALDRIDALLVAASVSPSFVAVSRGDPLSVPALPWASYYLQSQREIEEFRTLSDASTMSTITINTWHPAALDPQVNSDVVTDVWECIAAIRTSIMGDSDLNGNVTDLFMNTSQVSNFELNGSWFVRTETMLELEILGDTAIAK